MSNDTKRPPDEVPGEITRRDFIGKTLIGAGAALLSQAAPGEAWAAASAATPARPTGMTGLTAAWTGPGGIGDYANANGNTHTVVNRAHGLIRNEELLSRIRTAHKESETYDLIIVGGGISGLSAAYTFRKKKPDAKILILELQDMPGGEARQNEFEVDGHHLWAPQGSTAVGGYAPGGPFVEWHPLYSEIGLPSEFTFPKPEGLTQDIIFPTDPYLPMLPNSKGADVGYFFEGHGWVKNPGNNSYQDAPIPVALKQDLAKMASLWRPPYRKDWKIYLDSLSLQDWWTTVGGVSKDAVWLNEGEWHGVTAGLGPDAIAARDLVDSYYTHHEVMDDNSQGIAPFPLVNNFVKGVVLPGGNSTVARRLVFKLIPDAYPGAEAYGAFIRAQINRDALDRPGQPVRLRLNSAVVAVAHEGPAATAPHVNVTYATAERRLITAKGRAVVIAGQQHSNKKICLDAPPAMLDAMEQFDHGPVLIVNVAVRHWRFMDKLGISCARWFKGFGWFTSIYPSPLLDGKPLMPFDPNKPAVMTLYIPFLSFRGMPAHEQARLARHEMFALTFAEIERRVREQFTTLFGEHGFDADRDIAGIIANRQGHAYVVAKPGFWEGKDGQPAPSDKVREGYGRIQFAHAELEGTQLWSGAATEGVRAAESLAARS